MPKPTFFNLPDDKRDRITEVAIDEFSTYPYHQASLSRIVLRSGIAKGSMYQYFANKLDLYRWLVTDEIERQRGSWLAASGFDDPARVETPVGLFAALEQMLTIHVGFLLAHPRLATLAIGAMQPSADPDLRELHQGLRRQHISELTLRIREAQLGGEVRDNLEIHAVVNMIDAIVVHGTTHALADQLGLELPDLLAAGDHRLLARTDGTALVAQQLELLAIGLVPTRDATRTSGVGPDERIDRTRSKPVLRA
jgi:AcrR family transcriptional regulator